MSSTIPCTNIFGQADEQDAAKEEDAAEKEEEEEVEEEAVQTDELS